MKSLQRRYNLPNCILVLEGLNDSTLAAGQSQSLNILLNVECRITGHSTPLSGGKEFFTNLVTAVSFYAQECLSGIPRPQDKTIGQTTPLVQLKPLAADLHQLRILPETSAPTNPTASAPGAGPGASEVDRGQTINLTTVQLFDLVEAIDQFFADPLTLPDLTLPLSPVAKRDVPNQEPIGQRVAAPTLGAVGLALAAAAFFFSPVPEINPPEELISPGTSGTTSSGLDTPPGASGTDNGLSSTAETSEGNNSSEGNGSQGREGALNALAQVPEISDQDLRSDLEAQLYDRLNQAWDPAIDVEQNLSYQVSLNEAGAIVAAEPEDTASETFLAVTPLPKLQEEDLGQASPQPNALARFQVTFSATGELQVSPSNQSVTDDVATGDVATDDLDNSQIVAPIEEPGEPETENPETEDLGARVEIDPELTGVTIGTEANGTEANGTEPIGTLETPETSDVVIADAEPTSPGSDNSIGDDSNDDNGNNSDLPQVGNSGADSGFGEAEVEDLQVVVYELLDQNWTESFGFEEDLAYRVQVGPSGQIFASEPLSPEAENYLAELPLGQLQQSNPPSTVVEFRVVFTPSGVLQVSPWDGL
jgi:hypothetical protein